MKYLILSLLFCSCTIAPKTQYYTYECAALGRHGVWAKWTGVYPSEVAASQDGEILRKKLVAERLIPDNTGVYCYRQEEK